MDCYQHIHRITIHLAPLTAPLSPSSVRWKPTFKPRYNQKKKLLFSMISFQQPNSTSLISKMDCWYNKEAKLHQRLPFTDFTSNSLMYCLFLIDTFSWRKQVSTHPVRGRQDTLPSTELKITFSDYSKGFVFIDPPSFHQSSLLALNTS